MEVWKDVIGFEGEYQVSNTGLVKSVSRIVTRSNGWKLPLKERILKVSFTPDGYPQIKLAHGGKNICRKVHILVAQSFIGERAEGYQVNHIGEVKTNNHVDNLEYVTAKENSNHGTRNERIFSKTTNGKLAIPIIGTHIKTGEKISFPSMCEAERNGFSNSNISMVCSGKQAHHKGYIWEKVVTI